MAKGKKNKEKNRTKGEAMRDQYTVVLERVETKVDLLAEGQSSLRQEMYGRFESLEGRFESFQTETRNNFKKVFEYLSRIEDELVEVKNKAEKLEKNKIDKNDKEYLSLVKKVLSMDKDLNRIKVILKL